MTPFQLISFLLVAAGGTTVVLTRNIKHQVIVLSLYGLILTILFIALEAPDVALSELAVGAAALPLILIVAISKVPRDAL